MFFNEFLDKSMASDNLMGRKKVDSRQVAAWLITIYSAEQAVFVGKGSYGQTWLITGSQIYRGKDIAVKIIIPGKTSELRLQREVGGLRSISHESLVKFYGHRRVEFGELTFDLLDFEYIPGGDVLSNLLSNKPSSGQITMFARKLLSGVFEMHSKNILHRDLKPQNILLRDGDWDRPVIIDLGLSKKTDDATITNYPARVGTVLYMSPEQLRGEKPTTLSDLWACGAILYELLTGNKPFFDEGEIDDIDDLVAVIENPPRPYPPHISGVVPELALRLLEYEPYKRGSTQRALRDSTKEVL